MLIKKKKKGSLLESRNNVGYLFIAPFVIGFVFFLALPIMQSIVFSFSNLQFTGQGYELDFAGFENYYNAINVNPDFRDKLIQSIKELLINVPLIIIFSFFAANLLNQKFRGRTIARIIFFLPVIITAGGMLNIGFSDYLESSVNAAASGNVLFKEINYSIFNIKDIFYNAGLSTGMIQYIDNAIQSIYNIILMSGVQILIFLAGLQSVNISLYEAAKVEGATSWEVFWKITFPMISPLVFVNAFYSVIETFVNPSNKVIDAIQRTFFVKLEVGYGAAMSWIYFLIVFLMLALFTKLVSKRVFYNN